MKLGLNDPIPGAVALRFGSYCNWRQIMAPPTTFGHTNLVTAWGMLGNGQAPDNPPEIPDGVGDCGIVGPCHQIMQATAEAGAMAPFTTEVALKNYSAVTGFQPLQPDGQPWPTDPFTGQPDNPTDHGTAMDAMARYWRRHGFIDAAGARHPITAYLDLNPGDLRELHTAAWLFPLGVGCGYALQEAQLEQAQAGQTWDYVPGSRIVGGHYVPAMAVPTPGLNIGISWALPRTFTDRWHQECNNQGIVVLSHEGFVKARTLEGFDYATLADDLKQITAA